MNIEERLRYLGQCHQAVSIMLENIKHRRHNPLISFGRTILPNLQDLSLTMYIYPELLLKKLMMLKLKSLLIITSSNLESEGIDGLSELLSTCSLDTLMMIQLPASVEDIICILELPELQNISVRFGCTAPALV
ncbi:hypothetical protein BDQ12DRAFT_727079 [Crucibulum laeve]|uniref:F-box domain-containing protein n=1 Tax=Crucibulum laeve TaxID=68775 RepID=A0A5C3LZW2_9AGAR|nr:hypothetical protein BDQ12DRAFT_727079 [Crucibulum laeve]